MPTRPLRKCLRPGCVRLVSAGYCQEHMPKKERVNSAAWHYLYTNPSFGWKNRREAQLIAEPFCRECAKRGRRVRATDADHIVPHKGDVKLFMTGALESLCHSCHSRKTMAENAAYFATRKAAKR